MSNLFQQAVKPEFDFWEFVSCAICHLPFNSDLGIPQIPFWLTECGHIICNNHLNADQSCAHCGERGIQLVPLQQNMDAPMSDWFRSVPFSFDGAANAAKFQQETMASLIRYYKEKSRKTMDRLRSEVEEKKTLKKENDDLRHQNLQLQRCVDLREPSDTQNSNGKRPMAGSHGAGTHSSPGLIVTPLGPNRLTLPPGQDAPNFSRQQGVDDSQADNTNGFQVQVQRPGSSRFVESEPLNRSVAVNIDQSVPIYRQYAYNPPQSSQFQPPQLSHTQAATMRQRQAREQQRTMMPPPPPPQSSRAARVQGGVFKPARSIHPPDPQSNSLSRFSSQRLDQNQPIPRDQRQMEPPPTQAHTKAPNRSTFGPQTQVLPQASRPRAQGASFAPVADMQPLASFTSSSNNNRFMPTSANTNLNPDTHHFIPPTPTGGTHRFIVPGSRAPSRATNSSVQRGQRTPFVSGTQGG